MKNQAQLIISTIIMVWMSLAGYGQNVGDQFTVDGITYKITATTPAQVEIVDYDTNSGTEVTIPPTVTDQGTDYQVTAIGQRAFFNKQLTKLIFSGKSNVTRIGQDAFWGVRDLKNQLDSVIIPNSVTSLEQRAFGTCGLTSVKIPENITRLEKWVFAANDLREVTIPANVEFIGFQAFYNNLNLSTVSVQSSPPMESGRLDPAAFHNQANQRITFDLVVPPGAIQAYENSDWASSAKTITYGITRLDGAKYAIIDASNEVKVIGPSGIGYNLIIHPEVNIGGVLRPVTAIADGAFRDQHDLALPLTIVIPETVKSIGFEAFYTKNINQVIVMANEPPAIDPDAFQYPYRHDKTNVFVPKDRVQAYIAAGWTGFKSVSSLVGQIHNSEGFIWKVTSVNPNEVELIKFIGLSGKRLVDMFGPEGHVEIPSEISYLLNSEGDNMYTVTAIADDAFDGKRLYDGTDVIAYNYWTRYHDSLKSVDIPDKVTKIRDCAFCGNELASVVIPASVESIGNSAFSDNKLTRVDIPGSVESIGNNAFGNNNLTNVELPESVTNIGEYAFTDNQFASITTPVNVRTIDRWVYSQNPLTEVTISANVTAIELLAFENNPDLHLVTVEANDPPSLHERAFSNADRDQIDLVVPRDKRQEYLDNGWHGFRSISYGIFTVDDIKYGITSRTEVMVVDYTGTAAAVTIPETADNGQFPYTVTAIKENAFQNNKLINVEIPNSVTSIGEEAFSDNQLIAVTIPSSMERIGSHAFYNNPDLVLVTVEANDPPVLHATAFVNANRHQIDLMVPAGRMQVYKDNGWGGFKSTLDGSTPFQPTIDAPQSIDHLNPFTVNITFDGDVTDFEVNDIQITNATVSTLTGSGSAYTATIVVTSLCDGDITIDVPANVAMGINSLPNIAAQQVSVDAVTFSERCGSDTLVGLNRGFSPNGDGIADNLIIKGLEDYKNNVVKIYDLSQRLLFSAHYGGPGDGWDGTYKGSLVPVGSYVCVIDYNEPGLDHEAKMIYVNY